jgi:hypothetical protein
MRRIWRLSSIAGLVAFGAFGSARAQDQTKTQTQGMTSQRVLAVYHYLASSTMNDAYSAAYGAVWQGTPYVSEQSLKERFSLQFEGGLIGGGGDPIVTDTSWEVSSMELGMAVIPVGFAALYRLTGEDGGAFTTYAGIGLMGFLGAERMAIVASHPFWGEWEWNDTLFRASIAGQALVGIRGKVSGRFSFAAEVSWLQGGKGSSSGGREPTEEQIAEGALELAEAFQHPDFSFTGMRAGIGLQW